MSDFHLAPDDVAGYVAGLLGPTQLARVEAHASGCDACTAALAWEARFELALSDVVALSSEPSAARAPRRAGGRWAARAARVGFVGLAAAAAMLLAFGAAGAPRMHGTPGTLPAASTAGGGLAETSYGPDGADGAASDQDSDAAAGP